MTELYITRIITKRGTTPLVLCAAVGNRIVYLTFNIRAIYAISADRKKLKSINVGDKEYVI